ncbi:MAG: PilZ domain-containing protein [Stenotrophomonas nitritireducens]|uniref:PilZ domain-containing protein n=1 Tax=Stenotrophomonas TaxID=40323 RepID=UPI001AC1F5B8|nr:MULTISPECIES: PilZ domain-containing protein [Stenotrophomonas]MBN8790998.1 PilZ domain-containing protein [Stenotrophomonas nitritireducens]MBN8796613.1 PilZ domain-containing protein [Stenotrophomonas nitritireducens]
MNTSTERRHFWRAPFHSPARLVRADGRIHAGQVHDVSLKGALFEVGAGDDCRLDECCQLQVDLSEDLPIRMQATVVHVEGCNVGLRCDEIDLDSITALRRVIELNAADPALLERELGALVRHG